MANAKRERIELEKQQAEQLLQEYGSPLYVYDEAVLRKRCREMMSLVKRPNYRPNYSAKANTNVELLKIIREEGLSVDAMSPGEMALELAAGFAPADILFLCNNVAVQEMAEAVRLGASVSVDSLSQLESFGKAFPGGEVAVRLNPGVGAGHHKKVVTGGHSKFGVMLEQVPQILEIAKRFGLRIVGLNQHIGSLFLEGTEYIEAAKTLVVAAAAFPKKDLRFLDFGGGFGVPYHGEPRLDLADVGGRLERVIDSYREGANSPDVAVKTEPGRYVVAECGMLLGTVHSVKENDRETYVGCDIGFNVLMRPVLYDAYHEIEVFGGMAAAQTVTVVGNICESGDILAQGRSLPAMQPGDVLGVRNAGAYGYCMASTYNSRPLPAEVLLCQDGGARLIRRRQTVQDLVKCATL